MSRWGKNIVVPLDSLIKEKENTNRPTAARSAGTVGKWGKMGFTSTRTYALQSLSSSTAIVPSPTAAASILSPGQSPDASGSLGGSGIDDDLSPAVPEPPKPKKFFKSRNTNANLIAAQIIQHLPRAPPSPIRDTSYGTTTAITQRREPIKLKIPKTNSAEKKKNVTGTETNLSAVNRENKTKKKKEEKILKPEAPPSRIISRSRKIVNYKEDDDDERSPTPLKDLVLPKPQVIETDQFDEPLTQGPPLPPPPPLRAPSQPVVFQQNSVPTTPKTPNPDHPPIVLRISKGTSRLVSTDTDGEDQINSPQRDLQATSIAVTNNFIPPSTTAPVPFSEPYKPLEQSDSSEDERRHPVISNVTVTPTPKIIVKLPVPPPETASSVDSNSEIYDTPEINYCTVKISPDKPPKERLKLIIKTDVIRNALAAAAAAANSKTASTTVTTTSSVTSDLDADNCEKSEKPEKEKKAKSKKHKHLRNIESAIAEFKTPSPQLILGNGELQQYQRTVISPPALSERDFDSQSSVLGSISSKGNSTPQLLAQTIPEESCVIRSRGSSDITSDLETSQHSSLVAPPSDIESRLESMMDGVDELEIPKEVDVPKIPEEPLQEDIFQILTGGTPPIANGSPTGVEGDSKIDESTDEKLIITADEDNPTSSRRVTRGRKGKVTEIPPSSSTEVSPPTRRTRKPAEPLPIRTNTQEEHVTPQPTKRVTRRQQIPEKATEDSVPETEKEPSPNVTCSPVTNCEETNTETVLTSKRSTRLTVTSTTTATPLEETSTELAISLRRTARSIDNVPTLEDSKSEQITPPRRGGRITRNNHNSGSNNVNRIVAELSSKAAEASALTTKTITPVVPRSYTGRKRKNQQVTQVLQPNANENEPPTKKTSNCNATNNVETVQFNIDLPLENQESTETLDNSGSSHEKSEILALASMDDESYIDANTQNEMHANDHTSLPARRDKFKRTWLERDARDQEEAAQAAQATHTDTGKISQSEDDSEKQRIAVKLVISKKKGSIFKSRALIADQGDQNQKRHLYKHRWDEDLEEGRTKEMIGAKSNNDSPITPGENAVQLRTAAEAIFDDFSEDIDDSRSSPATLMKSIRSAKQNNNINCYDDNPDGTVKKGKGYYTVVRNVKTAHQIQEIGEYQEMDDDVEYILDALQPQNPIPTRCLSALQLASKCMAPAFRMHVRAHGVVTKFFKALSDANTDPSLGLCTSAIMFILSQDALNMDLDRDSLELMMNLLEADVAVPVDLPSFERNKQKIREFCEEIKNQGKATHFNVDMIAIGTLAMETLLSLTSKRAGEWFKEELRELGGLEHIIKSISECCRQLPESNQPMNWTSTLLDNLKTIERCLRVLENVTQMNEENQKYILTYANGSAVDTLCKLYKLCDREIVFNPTTDNTSKDNAGVVLREALIPLMKVLINLTHTFNPSNALGPSVLGKRDDIFEISLHILLQAPSYIPDRRVFELSILVLLLLINLTMYTVPNREFIMKASTPQDHDKDNIEKVSAIKALIEYFYKCEELARLVEKNTDAYLDNTDKNKKKQEEVDETVNNLLQKAKHHMEHTLKGSYAGILIGHLISDSEENENIVRGILRMNSFKEIVAVLEKYYTFMNLTASSEASVVAHIKSTKKLIDSFKKRDLVYEMNKSSDSASDDTSPLNLETTETLETLETTLETSSSTTPATRSNQRSYKTYCQR